MKKIVLFSLIAGLISSVAIADVYQESINTCDEAEMRAALDRATADKRAVITIVECDNGIVRTKTQAKPVVKQSYNTCGCGCDKKEEVVKREYFVRETVQQYKPVVQYVPAGTYTRVKPACDNGCF
jgi:hypothetical protein